MIRQRLGGAQAFQINCTPPEEKKLRQKRREQEASHEMVCLLLVPFCSIPRVAFENVKLGQAAVRHVTIQNPGQKPLKVALSSMPKSDRGFEVDFAQFTLPGRHEVVVRVGWVPQKGGNVREKIGVKYGSCMTQILLVGSCVAPVEQTKSLKPKRTPLSSSNLSRNRSGVRGNKAEKETPKPSVALPKNPVERELEAVPEFRPLSTDNVENQAPNRFLAVPATPHEAAQSWSPQKVAHISQGTNLDETSFLEPKQFPFQPPTTVVAAEARHVNHDPLPESLRGETFVKDPPSFLSSTPAPSNGDIFKFYDVSAIKNASGNLCVQQKTSQSAEKCSTSRELKFDEVTESHSELPPFKMPVEQPGDTDERVFRREAFVVDEIRSESSRSQQSIHQQNCHIQHGQSNYHFHQHHHHHLHQEQYQMHHEEQSVVSKYKLDDVSQLVHRVILEEGEEEENGRAVEKDSEPEPSAAEANVIFPSNLTRDDKICEEEESFVEDIKLDDVSLLIKEAMNITEDSDGEVPECQKEHQLDPSVSELKPNRTYDKEDEPKESNNLTFEKDAEISVSKDHFAMHETREFVHTWDETREQSYDRGFQPMSTLYEESSIPESFAQNTRNLTQTQASWESSRKESATFHVKKVSHCTKPESNQFSEDNPSEFVQFSEIETIQEVEERWEETIEEEKHEVVVKSVEIEEESRLMDVSLLIQEAISNEGQETTMQQMNEEEIRHLEQEAGIERSWNENERTFDKTPETAEVIEQRDASLVFPYPSQNQNQLSLLEKTKSPIEMNNLILEPLMESHLENEAHEKIPEIQNNHVYALPHEALPRESTPFRGRPRLSEALPPSRPSPNAQNLELFDKTTTHTVHVRSPSVEKVESVQEELPSQFFEITFDKPKKPLLALSDSTQKPAKAPMKQPRKSEPVPKITKPKTKPGGIAIVTKSANKAKINETFSAMKRPKQSLQRLTLIKPMKSAQSRSTVRHPNPFAAKNMYYDERWIQKQESGFTRWLNFILTPEALDDKDDPSAVPGKIDVTKVWKACSSNVRVPRAPTREVMSMRAYTVRRKMNQLRRHACTLWQTPGVAQVITKVEIEIEKKGLIIRKDKSLNKDVGMKKSFLELLLSYNPLWLKIGLETIYGELLSFTASDVVGLSQFILTRMLSNPDIQAEFAHPHVPHHFGPGYEEALKQYTLKKFLQVVFFLDQAKKNRLIKHDPCLFCKDSKVKMSKDVLVQFSRDFLAGEGDVIKHLAYLGFIVNHKQTPLDEFDYAVTNLAIDLKDGIRLSRVAGLFTSQELSDKLRMPAQSRLQKVHNVELALKALRNSGNGLPKDIDARSIVDGHMEKTLSLMWHIIYGFQLDRILDEGRLQTEIKHLFKSLEYRRQIGDQEASKGMNYILECKRRSLAENFTKTTEVTSTENDWMTAPKMKLLLEWARLVCAHYALEVENLTVSFSDGRCLCFMLHHYYPSFLPRDQIKMQTMMAQQQGSPGSSNSPALNCSLDDSFGAMTYSFGRSPQFYDELLNNEKANFKLIHDKINELGGVPLLIRSGDMSNTIPDQKVTTTFLIYLAARLLDLSVEMTAARTIQLAWRKYHANQVEKQLKRCHAAAKVIQCHARRWLHKIHVQKYLKSTLAIQRCYRKYITRKRLLNSLNDRIVLKQQAKELALREQQRRSAIKIQTLWRQYLCRKRFLSLRRSCLMLQAMRRKKVLKIKADLELQNKASRVIQRAWRRFQATRRWLLKNQSATSIQCWFRQILARRLLAELLATKREQACVKIQSWVKMTTIRKDYLKRRRSCILIQAFLRGSKIRNHLSMAKQIAKDTVLPMFMSIDEKLHVCLYQAERLNPRKSVEKAQLVRKYLVANQFENSEDASLSNALLRAFSRTQLFHIESLQQSAIIMQRNVRNWLRRLRSAKIITSSLVIQRWYRRTISRQRLMSILNQRIVVKQKAKAMALQKLQRDSAIKIQSQWRQYVCRKRFLSLRRCCLMLQAIRKKKILKIQANQRRKLESALIIQRAWKQFQMIRQWKKEKHSALVIQCWYRQIQAKRVLECLREKHKQQACLKIQTWFRTTVQRQKFVRILQATIVIQKHYKGQLVRNTFKACDEILSRTALPVCESKQEKMIHVLDQISEMPKVSKGALQSALAGTNNLNGYECALRRYHDKLFCRQQLKFTKAANLIQTATSRWLNALHVERKTRAAVIIQNFYFKAKARQALCLEITNRISRKRLLALLEQRRRKKASVVIQRAWRQHRAKLVQQRQYEAAITVQCWFRQIRAEKILNQLIKEHHNKAAVKLQAWTRMWMARKKFLRVLRAILIFQKAFRGQRLRKTIRLTQMITNATLLPLHVPLTEKSEWVLVHVRNLINNAQDMQLCHRIINVLHPNNDLQNCTHFETAVILCHQACVQKRVMNCHGASIVLQRFIRGWLARTRYFRQRQSAISIQKCYRKNTARRNLISIITERILVKRRAKELAVQRERNQAATVIQSHWRRFVLKTQFLALRRACLVMQAITRKKILRAKADRELKEKSAFIIQKAWKRFQLKKTQNERNCAAITLQCWYRNIQAKRIVDKMRAIKRHRACLKIQSWFRMKTMERKFGNLKRASIVIQKFSRGSVVRKSFGLVKEIQEQTLLPLSSSFLAKLSRSKIGESYENIRMKHILDVLSSQDVPETPLDLALVNLFNTIRRKQLMTLNKSAKTIQQAIKKWLQKCRHQKEVEACVQIQRFFRKSKLRHQLNSTIADRIIQKRIVREEKRQNAALLIQTSWRRYICRKRYVTLRRACVKMQSMIRQKIQQAKAQLELETKAATIIQSAFRRYQAAQKWQLLRKSAIVIQCWYRQILAESVLRHLVQAHREKAALIIQRAWNRHKFRKQWKLRNASATTIQCWYRQVLAKRALQTLVWHRREVSACRIQRAWKRFRAVQRWKLRNAVSTRIQCWYRRIIAKRMLHQLLLERRNRCAITIQRAWKRYQAIKLWKLKNVRATTIQCWYKQILAKKYLHQLREARQKESAIKIQRAWKRYRCVQRLNLRHTASIKIQCWFRQIRAKQLLISLRHVKRVQACFKIQKAWRRFQEVQRWKMEKVAASKIQLWYREILVQRELKILLDRQRENACRKLQMAWRRYRVVLKEKVRIRSIIRIQSWYRQVLARRILETLRAERNERLYQERAKIAGITVQSSMRMWKIRKEFLRIRRAVIVIQKVYRGHRVREAFKATCKIKQEVLLPDYEVSEELGKKIEQARQKVQIANQNATEDKKLGNRTAFALDCLYTSRDMAQLLQILNDLDVSTRFSANCCDQIVAENDRCIRILLDLLLRCNRSIPHMELIGITLDVFISLAKYEPSRVVLNGMVNDLVGTIIEVLHIFYKDKFVDIYNKGFALLWLMSFDDQAKTILCSTNVSKKILEMHKFYHRIHTKEVEKEKRRSNYLPGNFKKSQAKFKCKKLSLCPPWKMRADEICHHKEPFLASEAVLKKLSLKPLPLT